MAESVDEFFNVEDFKNSEISEQAATIHAFLSDSNPVAETTAARLISLSQASGGPELSNVVAQVIVPLAEEREEAHQALLKLLRELQNQVKATANLEPGNSVSLNYELWEKGLRYGDPDPASDLCELYRQEWTSLNRFAALVHEASIENLSAFGEHTLQLGLRKGGWRVTWKGSENTSDKLDALHGHAGAAAQWILVCGERLFDNSENVRRKWTQWEQALEWITGQDELKDETKSLCQQVLVEMRRIGSR